VQEVGGVEHLGLRLGHRLAHLERHEDGEVVGALDDQLVRLAQDLPPLARRRVGPLALRAGRSVERCRGVVGLRVGDLGDDLAGRGVLDAERPTLGGVAPLASDVEPLGDAVDDLLL
jgi:hypothetical protein